MPLSAGEIFGHADRCPKCGRDCSGPPDLWADYCPDCGTPLRNLCTKCGNRCPPSAAYCSKCGGETDYHRLGFV